MNKNTRMITEAALMIALGTALSFIKLFHMPQGGSITLASMVPVLIFAYRWGGLKGILVGAVYGAIQFFVDPFPSSIWSIIVDYPLAFASLGLIGFIAYNTPSFVKVGIGATIALLGRYICHVVSGVIFYASYAPEGVSPLKYSALYNSFMLPELLIALLILGITFQRIRKIKN